MKTTIRSLTLILYLPVSLTLTASAQHRTLPGDIRPVPRSLQVLKSKTAQAAAYYRPTETVHLSWDELDWINENRIRNEYADQRLINQFTDLWEGTAIGQWLDFTLTTYEYDGDVISTVTHYTPYEEQWLFVARNLYTVQNGAQTSMVEQQYGGIGWEDIERTSWTFTEGYPTQELTETWTGSAWAPVDRYTITEDGSNVYETYEAWTGSDWQYEGRYIYPNTSVAELQFYLELNRLDYIDYAGMLYALRLPDYIGQKWESGEWVDVARQTTNREYEFVSGTLYPIKETSTYDEFVEEEWVPTTRLVIDYVSHSTSPELVALPARTAIHLFDGENWAESLVESYILQHGVRRVAQATVQADFGEGLVNASQIRLNWTDVSTSNDESPAPAGFELKQNYPNPFQSNTRITYRLDAPEDVRLVVYDVLGRSVVILEDARRSAGEHVVTLSAANLPSGLYLYRLEVGSQSIARQMLVAR